MRWFNRSDAIVVADGARDAKQWDIAARHYRKALDRNPRNWPIWVQYGHALKEFGRHAEAEAAYRRALAYNPREADSHLQLGHVLKIQGNTEGAQAAYVRAFALDPSLPYPQQELASLDWSEAEITELLRQSLQRSPLDAAQEAPTQEDQIAVHVDEAALTNAGLLTTKSVGWISVTDVEISCLKRPVLRDEVALFVAHSPHGQLKPHVRHYLDCLTRQGIAVILVVAADEPFTTAADLINTVDGLFVRQNKGYDFAAWAHVLRLHPEFFDVRILYLLNDSIFGPTNDAAFAALLGAVRSSQADLVGLTDNYERSWHISSYFLALKREVLSSAAFREFANEIVTYGDKEDVINQYEIRLASKLHAAGLTCDALFPATTCYNSTIFHWKRLLQVGFPFLKVATIRDRSPDTDTSGWRELLAAQGYDVSLAEGTLAEAAASPFGATEVPRPAEAGQTFAIEDDASVKLHVDRPEVTDGRASKIIHGSLEITGWALARDGVAAIDILIDGKNFGSGKYGTRRYDVARAYPDWEASHLSGYALTVRRGIGTGKHTVRIELRTETGRTKALEFEIFFKSEQLSVEALRRKMPRSEIDLTENILSGLSWRPRFAILVGVSEADDETALDATLRSLREQAYGCWQAIVAGKESGVPERLAGETPDLGDRVSVIIDLGTVNLVEALTRANGGRRPDLVAIISAGDVLACDALLQMAVSTGMNRDADFFYSDERRMSPISGQIEAFFKPQWSPDLLLATNYVGRFWCTDPDLLDRIDAGLSDWRHFAEYDLVLRCTEAARGIRHVPHVLCERGAPPIDPPAGEREALARSMARRGIEGKVSAGCAPGYYRLRRDLRSRGLVSIIIPTRASGGLVKTCIDSLRRVTAYPDIEIIAVDDIPGSDRETKSWLRANADKVVLSKPPFNWSRYNNCAVREARGRFLLFLNDDIEIIEADWLDSLVQHAERREVGIVGARLLYPDGRVQHAGMFWVLGEPSGRHSFRFTSGSDPGYFGLAMTPRNVLMVTGACLMMRKSWFEEIGGFDESHAVINNDVDLCLRSWSNGGLVVYEPAATLVHHESVSRRDLPEEYDADGFWERWGELLSAGDPYYHPSLSRESDNYAVNDEPIQVLSAGHPLLNLEEIRRILVVKLDHIGDFIASLPALDRLNKHFPHAELYLLASPANSALAYLVPGISEVIEFEFYFPRSELGHRKLSPDDFAGLQRRLAPYGFDLAIDLREHLETRTILQCTGARWLAGYDRDNQFPWLDIAIEQELDVGLVAKRSQIVDDLCRLVDAVGLAANAERRVLELQDGEPWAGLARSGRRLVCVHPGVGDPARQWPPRHFAALIDLLVSNHDLDVVLIGSGDEAGIAAEVLGSVRHKEAVRWQVGTTQLADLPALLASAALFVGNNSGPNHIAAGLGVPAVGIYSGIVDARQWGAIGPNAVAVQRQMHCSPCYISQVGDCPRRMDCVTRLYPAEIYEVCRSMLAIARRDSPHDHGPTIHSTNPMEHLNGGSSTTFFVR